MSIQANWGYDADNGPKTWAKDHPAGNGHRQSPIDIVTKDAVFDKALTENPLKINYSSEVDLDTENNGRSFQADIKGLSTIEGGPLANKYRLKQFHFHWGSKDSQGSEHTVNGKSYAAELHFVHWNCVKYKTFAEAVDKEDGLAVIGVFLKIGHKNEYFQRLADDTAHVHFKGKHHCLTESFEPKYLLPGKTSRYWTYPGSLTTPPLYQSVTWIVLEEPIEVAEAQIRALRSLCAGDCEGKHIVDNYRPPCPLDSRQVKASFQ